MKNKLGNAMYFVLWPLVWLYAPTRVRVHAVIQAGGRILVVKNWFGPGKWQLPGGGLKHGENPAKAALREVREELGLSLDGGSILNERPLFHWQFGLPFRSVFVLIEAPSTLEFSKSSEVVEAAWLDRQAVDLPVVAATKITL